MQHVKTDTCVNFPNRDAPPKAGTPMLDGMNHLRDTPGFQAYLRTVSWPLGVRRTLCNQHQNPGAAAKPGAPSKRGADDESVLRKPVLRIKAHHEALQRSTSNAAFCNIASMKTWTASSVHADGESKDSSPSDTHCEQRHTMGEQHAVVAASLMSV
jgi:hypothetical protein